MPHNHDFSSLAKSLLIIRSQWCQVCVLWKEAQEPGVTTAPLPSGNLGSDDEDDDYNATPGPVGEGDGWSDPEAGYDGSDYEDYAPSTVSFSSICNT